MNLLKPKVLGALALLLAAGGLALYGQPGVEDKWTLLASQYASMLKQRRVQIDPAELLSLMGNDYVQLLILDLRTEPDWNLFHLKDAERISLDALPRQRRRFETLPANAVVVLVSNDESLSTQAWQHLMALGTPNAYILEGGINHWLDIYGDPAQQADPKAVIGGGDGKLRHRFRLALGERHPAARPDAHHVPRRNYNAKVKLITKVVRRAGCA